jgi:hypothetical protein
LQIEFCGPLRFSSSVGGRAEISMIGIASNV